MSMSLREGLSPLANRMPRPTRNIEVLRVSARLDGRDYAAVANEARQAVLAWAQRRAGARLPQEAWDHGEFELLAGGRNSMAVRVSNERADIWSLRAEDPDKDVAGRVWATEIVIGGAIDERPQVGVRLVVSTTEHDLNIEPHVPGLVLQLAESPGLIRGGRKLRGTSTIVSTEHDTEDLCDHLIDPDRHLPVVVASIPEDSDGETMIDLETVAKSTVGMARVFRLTPQASWTMTRRLGSKRSVFAGGVRIYLPGFSEVDDPYRHRLFLADHLILAEDQAACEAWLRRTVADTAIAGLRLGKDVLEFVNVRTASRRLQKEDAKGAGSSDSDATEAFEGLIASLESELAEKTGEIDGYVDEIEATEARAEASEQENRALLARIRVLEAALVASGETEQRSEELPSSWADFADWIDETYPDRVVLTRAARRMLRSPDYEDVTSAARMVRWLATDHFAMRMNGGDSLRDYPIEPGFRNSLCGGDEYRTYWRTRSQQVDWHVKNGGNTRDPRRCFRIYYFWEPETQTTVIDHLPGHRTTSAS